MPELWLRKKSPKVIFLNSNLPEKRYRGFRDKESFDELPEDSRDIFQRNMLDRYIDRPDHSFQGGKFAYMDLLCFAEFLSSCYVQSKTIRIENDYQPVVLNDELMEANHADSQFAKIISLMS